MRHNIFATQYRSQIQKYSGSTIPVVAGVLIMLSGILGGIWGCNYVADPKFDKESIAAGMSLLGAFYMVLTGLWFATRPNANDRRVIGLIIMIAGIVIGTVGGLVSLDREQSSQVSDASAIFFGGLIVHLLGVLYIRRE